MTPCVVSEKSWNTKEDKDKCMHDTVLYVLQLAKRHISRQNHVNSEEIKPIALYIVELCLTGDISYILKFSRNFLERFGVYLKHF